MTLGSSTHGLVGGNVTYAVNRRLLPYFEYSYFPSVLATTTTEKVNFSPGAGGGYTGNLSVAINDIHGGVHVRFRFGRVPWFPTPSLASVFCIMDPVRLPGNPTAPDCLHPRLASRIPRRNSRSTSEAEFATTWDSGGGCVLKARSTSRLRVCIPTCSASSKLESSISSAAGCSVPWSPKWPPRGGLSQLVAVGSEVKSYVSAIEMVWAGREIIGRIVASSLMITGICLTAALGNAQTCRFIGYNADALGPSEGASSINLQFSQPGCSWSLATPSSDWLTFTGPTSGVATDTFATTSYTYTSNATRPRVFVTHVIVNDADSGPMNIFQNSANCTFSVLNSPASIPASGGSGTISFTSVPDGCWARPRPSASWISVSSNLIIPGFSATYSVSPNNTGVARSGSITLSADPPTTAALVIDQATVNPTTISALPSTLTFDYQTGASTPAAKGITVSSANPANGVAITSSTSGDCGWMTLNPASGNTPLTTSVGVNTAGIGVGTHICRITFNASGASSQQVQATLTVTPPTAISPAPSTLTFDYQTGGSVPAAKGITVSSTNPSSGVAITSSTSGDCGWMTLNPTSGTRR